MGWNLKHLNNYTRKNTIKILHPSRMSLQDCIGTVTFKGKRDQNPYLLHTDVLNENGPFAHL